jgi:hypothetical protein
MLNTILLAAALATSDAPAAEVDATVEDVRELQGTWEVVEATLNGRGYPEDWKGERWAFAGDEFNRPGRRLASFWLLKK